MRFLCALLAASLLGACSFMPRPEKEFESKSDMSEVVRRSERGVHESHTLSSLVALEHGLHDFVAAEGRIPKKLDELIPKFLAGIPDVSLGIPEHKDNNRVRYYPRETIAEGQINGAMLEDTGGWGYAYNDRQVIIFVDCTHKGSNGQLWYQARGAN